MAEGSILLAERISESLILFCLQQYRTTGIAEHKNLSTICNGVIAIAKLSVLRFVYKIHDCGLVMLPNNKKVSLVIGNK
ncbi:hypothetical protein MRB53_032541 [Persea americana]|uniref:Uncharacterized protein n=1 Tax=Persea americana TaxID=3435 RepID=A0ACC2KS12_PERAE|nr:hypothetical protein MRB53_032541 [Persea americana]